ncbi:tripartite tricarboxylate transporter TctB family protein [Egicoccus sp. AB-alg2]|uniref:tripartite tricarboxylate transporter TctB family protein n=1 Tax=Egicoccus sp. AB-alg2 TaxID=3242693 RepID=UPI00359E6F8F
MSEQRTTSSRSTAGRTGRRPVPGRAVQEVVVAAVLLLGFVYLRLTLDQHVQGRRGAAYLDPDFWPAWLLNAGILFCLLYLVTSLLRLRARRVGGASGDPHTSSGDVAGTAREMTAAGDAATSTTATSEPPEASDAQRNPKALAGGVALIFGFVYLMPVLGFLPVAVLFCVAFLLFVGERRWYVVTAVPVVLMAAILYVFTRLLVVPLPRGRGVFLEMSTFLY